MNATAAAAVAKAVSCFSPALAQLALNTFSPFQNNSSRSLVNSLLHVFVGFFQVGFFILVDEYVFVFPFFVVVFCFFIVEIFFTFCSKKKNLPFVAQI